MSAKSNRLLLVGNFLSKSLATRHVCEDLAERLGGSGWRVITVSDKPHRLARLVDMVRTPYRKRHDYDLALIEVYSGMAFLWAEAACLSVELSGKPYALVLHGGNLPTFAGRWPRRVGRLLRRASQVVTPSLNIRDRLAPCRKGIQYLPNGLDLPKYSFRVRSQASPKLSWLRGLRYIYNPTLAVKTLGLLAAEFPAVQLNMVGPDQGDGSLEKVKEAADRLGVRNRLQLVGGVPKPEVPAWLERSDIFLNTTNYESFGIGVMEAAASGLCIVTTDVGELRYLWTDGQDALLVPPDDPEAMAAAVRRILTEPGLAERLSRNARHKAEQFDWSVILPQWEALLTAATEGHRS